MERLVFAILMGFFGSFLGAFFGYGLGMLLLHVAPKADPNHPIGLYSYMPTIYGYAQFASLCGFVLGAILGAISSRRAVLLSFAGFAAGALIGVLVWHDHRPPPHHFYAGAPIILYATGGAILGALLGRIWPVRKPADQQA